MKGGGWPAREDNRTDPKGGDAVVAGLAAWLRMFGSLCLLCHATPKAAAAATTTAPAAINQRTVRDITLQTMRRPNVHSL
jgi:mono/diheme cytochrome c family protein